MYGKIFDSMYEGTLYGHWEAIVTLQQMIVLCDSAGTIDMTPQAMSARTSIPLEIITKGLKILAEPDPYTRTPGEDGRRITLLDNHRPWGWRIVNHAKYQAMKNRQDKLEADRVRVAEKRKATKNKDVADCRKVSHPVAFVAHADADVYADTKTKAQRFALPPWIDLEAWKGFEAMRVKIRKPMTDRARAMIVKELEALKAQGHDPVKVLSQSEVHAWAGVFPIKVNGAPGPSQWWSSDDSILKKGRELGLEAKAGESMPSFKSRIQSEIERRTR